LYATEKRGTLSNEAPCWPKSRRSLSRWHVLNIDCSGNCVRSGEDINARVAAITEFVAGRSRDEPILSAKEDPRRHPRGIVPQGHCFQDLFLNPALRLDGRCCTGAPYDNHVLPAMLGERQYLAVSPAVEIPVLHAGASTSLVLNPLFHKLSISILYRCCPSKLR
jgi:hypothetical protein